ncbi:hypothetical protein TRVA0_076S00430 [Trichomonascus vanleenenianus]|uniref:F-box protein n=1 Tax=Trichomonascus vanleenenianus TaxID=2268995 RepID=UPI003ECB9C55
MLKLPREIWLIVLQYLREHDYDIDGHLWRVRLVCRALSTLADSLIWRKVSLVYDKKYKTGTCMSYDSEFESFLDAVTQTDTYQTGTCISYDIEFESLLDAVTQTDTYQTGTCISYDIEFESLLDAVTQADRTEKVSLYHSPCTLVFFLELIKSNAYKTQLEDRYSVIQHIEAAKEIAHWGRADVAYVTPCNDLMQALLVWQEKRTAGIKAITEALSAPYCGYTKPKYYSTEIHLYNIDRMLDVFRKYYPYIKHIKLVVGDATGCDSAIRHFAKLFDELLQDSRLETVDVTLKAVDFNNERKTMERQMAILRKVAENPPQRLLINVENEFTVGIVKILNTLPSDGTQLIIGSGIACEGPAAKLKANVISMKIRDSFDMARMQQFLSIYKSLTYLEIDLDLETGYLRLPDSVTHLTAAVYHRHEEVAKVRVSSSYLKSLTVYCTKFVPDAFVFPELEYLCVWDARICHTFGHGQRHFSKLKRLECADLKVGNDLTALLETVHPSESIVLDVMRKYDVDRQTKYAWFRHLLLSVNLPPLVEIRVARMELLPDDLYFFQRLLARQSSQVHIISSSLGYPRELKEIPAKYRTLLFSNVTYCNICDNIEARISNTYALTPDFVNAPLDNVDEKLRILLTTPPNTG